MVGRSVILHFDATDKKFFKMSYAEIFSEHAEYTY